MHLNKGLGDASDAEEVREILFKCGFAADLSDKSMVQLGKQASTNSFPNFLDSET